MKPAAGQPTTTWGRLKELVHVVPRELWLVYGLKVMESFAYFASSLNLTPLLTERFGMTDLEAGAAYSAWGVTAGVVGMAAGPLIDRLGVRRSLVVGGTLLAAGRLLFAVATTRSQAYLALFFLQSLGMTLAIPVLSIAVRRATTARTQQPAFGLFYSAMNVSALASGVVTDAFRGQHKATPASELRAHGAVFWLAAGVSCTYVVVAFLFFRDLPPVVEPGEAPSFVSLQPHETPWQKSVREARETGKDPVFWRLVCFSGVIFGARTIFRHMDATLPKYMERELGPAARYGTVYAINPAIIICAVPVVQAWLVAYDPYRAVLAGTTLTAAAPLVLAVAAASYPAIVSFMLLLSAGEAVYSPLLYAYAMALSPPGREGVYGTLAAAPLFLVQVVVGGVGGELLGLYCPADGPRRCQFMWFLVFLIAVTTPIGLVLGRPYLYNADVRRRVAATLHPTSIAAD